MVDIKEIVDFKRVAVGDRELYEELLQDGFDRGCEFSFANLFLWGRQSIAYRHGQMLIFSQFNQRSVYPFPVGRGDKRAALDAIIGDSFARGIPCRITGLCAEARELIEEYYPDRFIFHCDPGSFDYVYEIDKLAELSGRKYHGKKNHLNRFLEAYPDYKSEVIDGGNLAEVRAMADAWYKERLAADPNADFAMEMAALERAFSHLGELALDGLCIRAGGRIIAFTLGSRLSPDTLDVHFEKAAADAPGAYPAINYEFARYIREKYPEIRYLDREEDMGIEGLRRAKKSYHPYRMVEKCWAHLKEEGGDY